MSPQLSPWAIQAKEHWKKYRPKLHRELQEKGLLDQRAEKAAQQTQDELDELLSEGMNYDQAWELVREKYLFLPSEEDVPKLGEDSASPPLQQPEMTTASRTPTKSEKVASAQSMPTTSLPSELSSKSS